MKMGGNELEKLRGELSEITGSILRFIAERRRLSLRIGEVKAASGKPLLDREAEAALLRKMLNLCGELGLDEELCRRILLMLIEDSLNLQRTKLIEKKADPLAYRKIFARAAELYRMGKPVIRTEVGQPDFTAPPEVMAAAYEAMRKGYGRYAPAAGIPELRKALAENLSQRYGVDLKPENVVVTLGGAMAVYSAIEALTKPGDEVMVVEPAWPIYGHQARTYGRRVVSAMTRLEDGWDPIKPLEEGHTSSRRQLPQQPYGEGSLKEGFREASRDRIRVRCMGSKRRGLPRLPIRGRRPERPPVPRREDRCSRLLLKVMGDDRLPDRISCRRGGGCAESSPSPKHGGDMRPRVRPICCD